MFAPIMIIVPFYILMRGVGLQNSHLGLILSYTTFALPFSMWLLRSFFQSIPLELEQAAMTDGASRPQAVLYVIVPLALPGVIAVSIFAFIVAWVVVAGFMRFIQTHKFTSFAIYRIILGIVVLAVLMR